MSHNPTPPQYELNEIMKEVCGENGEAYRWWNDLKRVVFTWDHLVDGDEVDVGMAEQGFMGVMLEWPTNRFYQGNMASLVPVMVNAWSAWQWSNEEGNPKLKAMDIYTEVACTIVYLLHGVKGVEKYMPHIRDLHRESCELDDQLDGGKK